MFLQFNVATEKVAYKPKRKKLQQDSNIENLRLIPYRYQLGSRVRKKRFLCKYNAYFLFPVCMSLQPITSFATALFFKILSFHLTSLLCKSLPVPKSPTSSFRCRGDTGTVTSMQYQTSNETSECIYIVFLFLLQTL